jgi:hypothetical protein
MDRQNARLPFGGMLCASLSSAREAAAAIVGDVAKGKNPAAERKEAVAAERQNGRGTALRSGCSSRGQLTFTESAGGGAAPYVAAAKSVLIV